MISPWTAMIAVLVALAGLIALLKVWQRFGSPSAETTRKVTHMIMGLVTLSFPWIFHEKWTVVVLSVITVAVFISMRLGNTRLTGMNSIINGIERISFGEIYFPISIMIVFVLSFQSPLLFCIPVLILTFADAGAAIFGMRWKSHKFITSEGAKTLVGCITFFTLAFLCTSIPLIIFGHPMVSMSKAIMIGVILGFTVMLLEAIALRGRDNLYLPIGSFLLLKTYLNVNMSSMDLAIHAVAIALFLIVLILFRNRTVLDDAALAAGCLVLYVTWMIGGIYALIAPLTVYLTYTLLYPNPHRGKERGIHNVHAVFAVATPGLTWLLLSEPRSITFFVNYMLAYHAELGIIGLAALAYDRKQSFMEYALRTVLLPVLIMMLFFFILPLYSVNIWILTLYGIVGVSAAVTLFYFTQPEIHQCPRNMKRWIRQAAYGIMASLAGYLYLVAVHY